ncbi:MAG: methionyl-tRNA formyltransferase [Candidatus Nanopelagicaceae bacterium]|nr:methionyl-tRNA formyltransferase [Candidatus Nanopelagicaceae bacterium]
MNIVLASSSKVAIPVLNYLVVNHNLRFVLTGPDKPTGRGRTLMANDFADYCSGQNLTVFKPSNDIELESALGEIKPDLVITAAYGRLIKQHQLSIPTHGWLNIHFSLLPRWRGAAPVQFTILNGDKVSGVTVFKLEKGVDTGPIYAIKEYGLQRSESAGDLLATLSELAIQPLEESIVKIAAGEEPVVQNSEGATLAPKISKSDGMITWSDDVCAIERKVRAFSPWPGAWSRLNGKHILILEAQIADLEVDNLLPVGTLQIGNEVLVKCGNGALLLKKVKPEGKKEMLAMEWIRGIQNKEHLRFDIS